MLPNQQEQKGEQYVENFIEQRQERKKIINVIPKTRDQINKLIAEDYLRADVIIIQKVHNKCNALESS